MPWPYPVSSSRIIINILRHSSFCLKAKIVVFMKCHVMFDFLRLVLVYLCGR